MNNFYTPALFISDYYDSLVREIDIYTEELMNEYSESDSLPPEPERIFVHKLIMTKQDKRLKYVDDNKYTAEYEYEVKKNLEVIPGSTKVHEYLNMVRENAIAVIRKSEQDSFRKYNENRDKFKMIKGNINEEQIEMLKKNFSATIFASSLESIIYRTIKMLFQIVKLFLASHYSVCTPYKQISI